MTHYETVRGIQREHQRGLNLKTGQAWCLPCDLPYPCPLVALARDYMRQRHALEQILEAKHIYDGHLLAKAVLDGE